MVIMLTLQINIYLGGINTNGQIPRDAVSDGSQISFPRASPENFFRFSSDPVFSLKGVEDPSTIYRARARRSRRVF